MEKTIIESGTNITFKKSKNNFKVAIEAIGTPEKY